MQLDSKNISIRLVNEDDAQFILDLRNNKAYNAFLSKVSSDLQSQIDWIRDYKKDEQCGKQYYFIIERLDGVRCGTVRVYDLQESSFCWGSWILNEDKTKFSSIESALLVYQFGFNALNYQKSHFDVVKGNTKVISFHKKMGAKIVREDEVNYYFEISKESVEKTTSHLLKLI